MEIKRHLLIGMLVFFIMFYITLNYCYNPNGHDYKVYSERVKVKEGDLYLSWFLMKCFTIVFNNPVGLYLLNFSLIMFLFLFLWSNIYSNGDMLMFICFPVLMLGNPAIQYMMKGNIRNVIGIVIIIFYIVAYDYLPLFFSALLLFTHIPSFIIYSFYIVWNRKDKMLMLSYSFIIYVFMMVMGFFKGGELLNSFVKPIELILLKFQYSFFIHPLNYMKWNRYYLFVAFVYIYMLYCFNKYEDKFIYKWWFLALIINIPLYSFKVMFRFLTFTYIPLTVFTYYRNLNILSDKIFILVYYMFNLYCDLQ